MRSPLTRYSIGVCEAFTPYSNKGGADARPIDAARAIGGFRHMSMSAMHVLGTRARTSVFLACCELLVGMELL